MLITGAGEVSFVKHYEDEEKVLEGVLIPAGWGPSGELAKLALMSFDEREYSIDSAMAKECGLIDHLREHVRLSAIVRDSCIIRIARMSVLGNESKR